MGLHVSKVFDNPVSSCLMLSFVKLGLLGQGPRPLGGCASP